MMDTNKYLINRPRELPFEYRGGHREKGEQALNIFIDTQGK